MLKRLSAASSAFALVTLMVVTAVGAQGPRLDPPPTEEDGDGVVGAAMAMDCPMMGGGAHGMGAHRGMGMGRGPMMGMQGPGMGMGMGPMGGMMGAAGDPKQAARMMQMRGDMLKAMGEVMLKYGKLLEQGQ